MTSTNNDSLFVKKVNFDEYAYFTENNDLFSNTIVELNNKCNNVITELFIKKCQDMCQIFKNIFESKNMSYKKENDLLYIYYQCEKTKIIFWCGTYHIKHKYANHKNVKKYGDNLEEFMNKNKLYKITVEETTYRFEKNEFEFILNLNFYYFTKKGEIHIPVPMKYMIY